MERALPLFALSGGLLILMSVLLLILVWLRRA